MTQVRTNGIFLEAEVLPPPAPPPGAPARLPVLLIMGLGMQLTAWPDEFVQGLLDRGHAVVRFDNRDIGLSSKLGTWGRPNLMFAAFKQAVGLPVRAAYTLHDMARDTDGMLEALGMPRVHVVGVSMGGMIGQLLAAQYPGRVASFTCVMTSSGAPHLPGPTPAARRALLDRPKNPHDHDAAVDHFMKVYRAIGSPGYATPEPMLRQRILRGIRRSVHPLGFVRQVVAIAATGDRSRLLAKIKAPTTVVHGRDDPLVPVAAATDLAGKIPGGQLRIIDGMGHDLPTPLVPTLLAAVEATIARAG